jgi:hypothetical protein
MDLERRISGEMGFAESRDWDRMLIDSGTTHMS